MEAAQGIQNALPNDNSVLGGLNEATYLAQQAKSHGLNVMRLFGIADVNYSEGSPLQPSPGLLLGLDVPCWLASIRCPCSFYMGVKPLSRVRPLFADQSLMLAWRDTVPIARLLSVFHLVAMQATTQCLGVECRDLSACHTLSRSRGQCLTGLADAAAFRCVSIDAWLCRAVQ